MAYKPPVTNVHPTCILLMVKSSWIDKSFKKMEDRKISLNLKEDGQCERHNSKDDSNDINDKNRSRCVLKSDSLKFSTLLQVLVLYFHMNVLK